MGVLTTLYIKCLLGYWGFGDALYSVLSGYGGFGEALYRVF